ncbi:MAG TPA: hypothetical protein VGD91_18220, partial [Trebonia sp.]
LVVQPFVAWESALPLPPARRATAAVTALVEMLADDHAARAVGRPALARALVAIGGTAGPVPNQRTDYQPAGNERVGTGAPGAARSTPTLDRVQRLVKPPGTSGFAERLIGPAAWLAAVLLVAAPTWYVLR